MDSFPSSREDDVIAGPDLYWGDVSSNHHATYIGINGGYAWYWDKFYVCSLRLVRPNELHNTLVAKVYMWEGEITHSIKVNLTEHPDYDYIIKTVELEKEFLSRKIAERIAERIS
jgi:hypothetical protein